MKTSSVFIFLGRLCRHFLFEQSCFFFMAPVYFAYIDFKNSLNCLIIAVPHTKYRHNIQLILDNILQKHDNEDFNIRNIIIDIKGICNNVDIPDNTVIWAYS